MFKMYPQAWPVTRPQFDLVGFSTFFKNNTGLEPITCIDPRELNLPNHCDLIPMMAGKTCYLSFEKGKGRNNAREHLGNLIRSGHGSVLEHTNVGFIILTSRDISHELVRHRAGFAYSQLSQRYVDKVQFLIPPELHSYIVKHTTVNMFEFEADMPDGSIEHFFTPENSPLVEFIQNCERSAKKYKEIADKLQSDLIDNSLSKTDQRKVVNQTARSILPNATVTYMFMTGNLRAWRGMLEARCSKHAATGIRHLCNQIYDCLKGIAPACMQDYSKLTLPDGSFELLTDNKKI
jgi:thymidylate synthase (FAD)